MIIITPQAKFPLGQIVITPNALSQLSAEDINSGLRRHAFGEWGQICPDDAQQNDEALLIGERLLSSYSAGTRTFWIITERDRSVTTILMPEDY